MRNLQSLTVASRRIAVLAAFAAGSLLVSGSAAAQQRSEPLTTVIMRDDGTAQQLPATKRGFNLFAEEDLAGASLRLTGLYRFPMVNAGLCPFANTSGDIFNTSCAQFNGNSTFFHLNVAWGIGPDDFTKIKDAWPAVANMRAPVGYSTPWRITSLAPITIRLNAADGQFGQFYSGVTSLNGAGCRDMSGAQGGGLPQNFTLTALADCPETWASTGFDGVHEVPDSVWQQRFQANPVNFRWDDWRIPKSAQSEKLLGTNSSYGAFSDYPREIVQLYGGITPKGKAGDPPGERGFPIGIWVREDAWKFDRPSLRDGVFVRFLVVNNSEKVWGKGIDYDKLYFGFDPGYTLGGQFPAAQNIPKFGVHLGMGGGWVTGRCTNTFPKRVPPAATEACHAAAAHIHMIQFLKSPLGDLRNKLFSDITSPYYFPNHPAAGDTITFNHWVRGGFGAQDNFSWRRSDRALFGLMSGDEVAWLDGRQFTDFSAGNIWTYFRYEFTDGTQSLANLRYNKSVPGNIPGYGKWDYNHDGVQDTLFLPDCGSLGCAGLWGDSIAGGFSNGGNAGNIGNYLGVGPFALKAGDTTEFLIYMAGSRPDTISGNRMIAAGINALYKNFAGASAYPTPVFTANDVQLNSAWFRDSTGGNQNTEVRIQIKMPPVQNDKFIASVLSRIQANEPVANNLRALNPNLVNIVTGRMKVNLAQLLVFKSCDNGVSWTNETGQPACIASTGTFRTRNQDGVDIGVGWRPLQVITADSTTGALSTYIVSDIVESGHDYVYSFVTKTRGLFDIKVITSVTLNGTGGVTSFTQDNLQNVLGIDIDTIYSSLAPNGPFTVHAYAPISVPAGTLYARLDTARAQSLMVTNRVNNTARSANVDGAFRMRFGNRWILTRTLDTVSAAVTTTLIRQSVYTRAADGSGTLFTNANTPAFRNGSPTVAAGAAVTYVASADTFTANHGMTYSTVGGATPTTQTPALRATPRSTTGNVQTFIDTLNSSGYVLARGGGATDPYYLWLSNTAASYLGSLSQPTSQFEGDPWYPGFTATINSETAAPAARVNSVLRGPLDTLNTTVTGNNAVTYQSGQSGLRSSLGGFYSLEWSANPFGAGENNSGFFTFNNAEVLQPTLNTSLAGREVGTVADTTSDPTKPYDTRTLIAAGTNNLAGRPLLAAKIPFRLIGSTGAVAKLAFVQRHVTGAADSAVRNSRLFGTNGDTVRLAVPPDVWMPGDTVYVVEQLLVDSTAAVGGTQTVIMHDTTVNGVTQSLPIQVTRWQYGAMFTFGCTSNTNPTRITCNPIRIGTKGWTGYLPMQKGWALRLHLNRNFDQNSEVDLSASPTRASALPLQDRDMDQIHVVPNPFVVSSAYDRLTSGRVVDANIIKFVNVPSEGMIRIYTISGQLMQQLTWTASDLVASGNGSPHGDLPYNLRTREGLDLSSGVYLYVLTARGEHANGKVARGKFVVIR
ncbi:MAG TPA: hypothetical protein VE967_12845 [Gemmatimonadaceae bacterium]|nr:hypothetical protein [Gemmatimonadaceae bacterium]